MVQMSSLPNTRSKAELQTPAEESALLGTTWSESESNACHTSKGARKDLQKLFPSETLLQQENGSEKDDNDFDVIDFNPSLILCRVCRAPFTSSTLLAHHLQEKHVKLRGSKAVSESASKALASSDEQIVTATPSALLPSSSVNSAHARTNGKRRRKKKNLLPSKRSHRSPLPQKRNDTPAKLEANLNPPLRPTKCILCDTNYRTYKAWHEHAVGDHILKEDPKLAVEMNYVDIHTLNKNQGGEGAIITTATVNGTPGRGCIQEQLKLTFCREKGRYVVKKPSFTEEISDPEITSSTSNSDENIARTGITGMMISGSLVMGGIENHTKVLPATASLSPILSRETGSSSRVEINLLADKENSVPQVVGAISAVEGPGVGVVSKVPTSGTIVYLGIGASESDRTLANTGNSHMVIIQNDILHIGADADEENIQRITSATATNNNSKSNSPVHFRNRKVMETLKGSFTEELNISVDKDSSQTETEIVSVRNMSPFSRPEEVTAMLSEEIPSTKERQDEIRDDSSPDNLQLRIAIGENDSGSPSDPQESLHLQQDSPKELLPHESSPPMSGSEIRNGFEVPKSVQMPLRIKLPCGIEIQQLPIRRESMESNQSEDIDVESNVDESNVGNSRTSQVSKHEDNRTEETEVDDFRCKVCNALFTSDDDLETHFSQAHFRGIANNILEPPESPFVGASQEPPPAHASSNGSIFRASSTENIARNFSMQSQLHAHSTLPPGSRSERRTSDERLTEFRVTNGNFTNSQFFIRGDGGAVHALQMRAPPSIPPPNNDRGTTARQVVQALHPQGDALPQRSTELFQGANAVSYASSLIRSSSANNLQMQLHRNAPPLPTRSSTTVQHPAPFQYLPQQVSSNKGDAPPKTYPNALHNALNSVVQLGSQRHLPLPRQNGQENETGNSSSGPSPTQQSSSQQRSHLIAMAQHHQRQQQYQLLQQQSMRSRQAGQEQQQQRQGQPTVTDLRQQAIMLEQQQRQARSQQYPQNVLGKRPSPQEMLASLQKQARIDAMPPGRLTARGELTGHALSSSPGTSPSQLASALGSGGVRLGTSVTLSVYPGDEAAQSQQVHYPLLRNSIGVGQGQSQRSPTSVMGQSSTMTNALAVRGVTVSPASPTHPDNIPNHRLQANVNTSPSQSRLSSPSNAVAVIQNGGHSNTPSPPSHQFIMPQNPAPRGLDRPDRPPTVDLTTDEMNAYAAQQSRYMEQQRNQVQGQANSQRLLPRPAPAVACNLCGVLFGTVANLEEHKIHRHGFRPGTGGSSASPTVGSRDSLGHPSPPLRGQQPQSVRSSSSLRSPPSNASQRSLFIPLLDISRLDPTKLKRLEELGVCSMIPLHGNDRALGQMGIPLLLPTVGLRDGHHLIPWDQLQPVGPIYDPAQLSQSYGASRTLTLPSPTNH